MQLVQLNEYDIQASVHQAITTLRNACFPNAHVARSYYKQLPHFRYLAYDGDHLIAHMGVDYRVISVGGVPVTIFGVIDLCVAATHRGRGIARRLLDALATLARERHVDFLFLLNQDHRVYEQNGFAVVGLFRAAV